MLNKIITFSGNQKSGKTTLALITSQYLSDMNYKVLLIDCDFKKKDLSFILKSDLKVNIKNDNIRRKNDAYGKKEKFYNNEYEKLKKNNTNFLKLKDDFDKDKSKFLKSKNFLDKYKNKILKSKDIFKNNKLIKIKN